MPDDQRVSWRSVGDLPVLGGHRYDCESARNETE